MGRESTYSQSQNSPPLSFVSLLLWAQPCKFESGQLSACSMKVAFLVVALIVGISCSSRMYVCLLQEWILDIRKFDVGEFEKREGDHQYIDVSLWFIFFQRLHESRTRKDSWSHRKVLVVDSCITFEAYFPSTKKHPITSLPACRSLTYRCSLPLLQSCWE